MRYFIERKCHTNPFMWQWRNKNIYERLLLIEQSEEEDKKCNLPYYRRHTHKI